MVVAVASAESKSLAPHCRQITTPAPHHSMFYRSDALLDALTNSVKALKAILFYV